MKTDPQQGTSSQNFNTLMWPRKDGKDYREKKWTYKKSEIRIATGILKKQEWNFKNNNTFKIVRRMILNLALHAQ